MRDRLVGVGPACLHLVQPQRPHRDPEPPKLGRRDAFHEQAAVPRAAKAEAAHDGSEHTAQPQPRRTTVPSQSKNGQEVETTIAAHTATAA